MVKTSERLLALLSLLQARRDWPGALLAERLDISPRTVRRDVDRLRELGYAVTAVKGPDGGYRLEAGSALPPLLFDDDQAVALAVSLQVMAAEGGGLAEGAARALHTVRQLMPSRLLHRMDAVAVTAVRAPAPRAREPVDAGVVATLGSLVRSREVLRFDYRSPDAGASPAPPRRAEPHHLVTWGGRWYLVAWDLDRDDWRTFRVDRIEPRTPNGPRFTPRALPAPDLATFVTARFRGTDGPVDWPCRGEVVVHLPASEVMPYATDGVVEPLGASRCRLVQGSWSWTALAASLGRFDAELEIVGPAELVDACTLLASRYARAAPRSSRPG
jgi:predicted DNA-binding transcriptional regulator YafY